MTYPTPYDADAYPQAVYQGDGGEVSALLRRADRDPELDTGGGTASYLATGASTHGRYGFYRWDMGPEPSGPAPHFHRTMSEAFFTLAGTVRLFDGEQWVDTQPGDFCYVPEGGIHGFRNESGEPASMLILFSPGAPRERYFEGLAAMVRTGEWPSQGELLAFFAAHDNHYL